MLGSQGRSSNIPAQQNNNPLQCGVLYTIGSIHYEMLGLLANILSKERISAQNDIWFHFRKHHKYLPLSRVTTQTNKGDVSPLKWPFAVRIPKVSSVQPVPSRKSAKKIEFQGIPDEQHTFAQEILRYTALACQRYQGGMPTKGDMLI
eukprot:920973-Prorocentrum_minimum.AAC.2